VWNILNVWKYGHLSENLTFIGHLCEISSMCKKYGHFDALCFVSDGNYWIWLVFCLWWKNKGDTRYGCVSHIWSKGRCTLSRHVSHLKQIQDARYEGVSPFYFPKQKDNQHKLLQRVLPPLAAMCPWVHVHHIGMCGEWKKDWVGAVSCSRSSKLLYIVGL
jgi:hypothetical protein